MVLSSLPSTTVVGKDGKRESVREGEESGGLHARVRESKGNGLASRGRGRNMEGIMLCGWKKGRKGVV